jgi:hypothetical protein
MVGYVCNPGYSGDGKVTPAQNKLKTTVAEHLPIKCQAPSSTPVPQNNNSKHKFEAKGTVGDEDTSEMSWVPGLHRCPSADPLHRVHLPGLPTASPCPCCNVPLPLADSCHLLVSAHSGPQAGAFTPQHGEVSCHPVLTPTVSAIHCVSRAGVWMWLGCPSRICVLTFNPYCGEFRECLQEGPREGLELDKAVRRELP